ncbi:BadF/BadG/BcrA/BcrD ATPase family protein [Actinosynnema sp. NPDC047251]|uniref:Putative inase n=1 Tax=Saccharothrix espanaensis (strain ATCC 51144 / DSM 44229 / JCM 9112 / NBRC 15066 / NRRL 15764) TaxID=1179773 RepID=K0JQ92_SACES|nr:BadF/BadG/BcrA/BcrD ATPase family protein [Saccharothrix espanaensis]CCH27756.1 putative inase [Saccharothrix espanaensis DSM 44229]
MTDRVLAIDGGNSKTAVALVDLDGRVLAQVRGPGASPQNVGLPRSLEVFEGLARSAARQAGLAPDEPIAAHTAAYLAGADLPQEEEDLRTAIEQRGWSATTVVGNDTFALLRAGTSNGIGVAVVCGAGINCVAVAPDGRTHRFPALGPISGDWGGGGHIGGKALWLAVRAEDGRGAPTALLPALIAHYGAGSLAEVVERLHFEQVEFDPHALCRLLFQVAAGGDAVALTVVDRLVEEVVLLASVSLRRLALLDEPVDVVLGGGVLTGTGGAVVDPVRERLGQFAPRAEVRVVDVPPVVGAALLGLDALGAAPGAELRLRAAYEPLDLAAGG